MPKKTTDADKKIINEKPKPIIDLDFIITKLNTCLTVDEYNSIFLEGRSTIWRAISSGELETFSRGRRKIITGLSAAKRNRLEHLIRELRE